MRCVIYYYYIIIVIIFMIVAVSRSSTTRRLLSVFPTKCTICIVDKSTCPPLADSSHSHLASFLHPLITGYTGKARFPWQYQSLYFCQGKLSQSIGEDDSCEWKTWLSGKNNMREWRQETLKTLKGCDDIIDRRDTRHRGTGQTPGHIASEYGMGRKE